MKQIVSLALSNESIEMIDKYSSVFGMNRSEFVEWFINKVITKDIVKKVRKIRELQRQLLSEFCRSDGK